MYVHVGTYDANAQYNTHTLVCTYTPQYIYTQLILLIAHCKEIGAIAQVHAEYGELIDIVSVVNLTPDSCCMLLRLSCVCTVDN